ncbi:MAG TPA: CBS domain-containing protein [Candidatus Saccharimonadales bacterium]|nr:CBS domain-containing protein [Candidatus Saccharimonadales bacterium]
MEIVIQVIAVLLTFLLAVIKSLHYSPVGPSDFELSRKAEAGDKGAIAEWHRRNALPTLTALQFVKEIIISVLIAWLLLKDSDSAVGPLLVAVYFILAYIAAARGWLGGIAKPLQQKLEPFLIKIAVAIGPFMKFMTAKDRPVSGAVVASRSELSHLIDADRRVLTPTDKQRLQGALAFGGLKIKDVMVPRGKIKTVELKDTVGPVLLDRLHKDGHKMFVVVKKDIGHIEGLLYMSDVMSGHPDIKIVEDAVRKSIVYLPEDEELLTVLGASLQTGKQLFIVVDNQGNTTGLITLRDTLAKLLGVAPPDRDIHLSTDPKEMN